LQLVAAGAVDRTRKQATAAPKASTAWTTGWRDDSASGTAGPGNASGAAAADGETASATGRRADSGQGSTRPDDVPLAVAASGSEGTVGQGNASGAVAASGSEVAADAGLAVDDGYRNTTEFLRTRLRISAAEARRRLALARDLLPRQGFSGDPLPPAREELGAAVAAGEVSSRAATIITLALDRVRHTCNPEAAAGMEHALTRTAAENDPDLLARAARSWTDALDQDGAEPSEELLRQLQGAFIRKPRHGLQHLEIFATAEQFEHLLTLMNTATNPRTTHTETPAAPGDEEGAALGGAAACEGPSGADSAAGTPEDDPGAACLDLRSQPQKRLDGLVGACKVALAAGALPAAGGLRPQVMVTIDYRDLLARLEHLTGDIDLPGNNHDDTTASEAAGHSYRPGAPWGLTGTMLFTGPVTASTVRKIACDADIIPVLLGGEGRILDIGRASRVFPPHIRKALTARDQGCAFPGCTIPAPWCEAHHITYWSRGGPTGTENGTLLCSHHHHVIHKEQWTIQLRTGIPWFIPPPHIDPRQKPRRNYYFHPADLGHAA
ncbi:DUF222 domain-containing protein, partial [uncultured Arthrobacter sp.]|uniref:DUF222 domain-containing protein n=1 Tax=uncultured Arthrobacter sp. TaxID=114050 RepID=UPI003217C243